MRTSPARRLGVASDVATSSHYRSKGSAPTLTACGTGASVLCGNDAAGVIATGTGTSSCTINFAKPYAGSPICMVQTYSNASPVPYLTSFNSNSIKVTWNATFNGAFMYLCETSGDTRRSGPTSSDLVDRDFGD